jgi:uncharacterized membrane protein YeiH
LIWERLFFSVSLERWWRSGGIGLFVLALACGLGGGLLRDGLFIQTGPPAAMRNGGYMIAVLAGCVVAIVLFQTRGTVVQAVSGF